MHILRLLSCCFIMGSAASSFASTPVVEPDTIQLVTNFTVTAATQVPGKTLKAGNYSIRVVDHLSDRVILQIEDAKGSSQTRFLALENAELRSGARQPGPLTWSNGTNKTSTLRGFAFPGGATVEFVYPKKDAVLIAKVNASKVPAIDPESEGRVAAKNLSTDDLQTVTLWTLLATRVGPADASQPAIEASRYQPPVAPSHSEQNVTLGSVNSTPSVAARVRTHIGNAQVASLQRPSLKVLPHTASFQPLIASLGLMTIFFGGLLHFWQRRATHEPA